MGSEEKLVEALHALEDAKVRFDQAASQLRGCSGDTALLGRDFKTVCDDRRAACLKYVISKFEAQEKAIVLAKEPVEQRLKIVSKKYDELEIELEILKDAANVAKGRTSIASIAAVIAAFAAIGSLIHIMIK
jgi:hypothetical protein